jgi:serine/threonine-protein kinase
MPAVLGGYQLLERIAVGGMAEVFLAKKRGKRVAIKRILPHLGRVPDFVRMFLEEARLLARLSHDNVVKVHDFGVDGGVHYLAMEHVAGCELEALIRRAAELGRPLPVEDALAILSGACEGLHHVHEQGIVHRDVTPSNLLVSWDGVVKLADFGIAKLEARPPRGKALKGKLPYMSPEQARGERLDRRSDIYALGVCAWELFTLERLRPASDELLPAVQSGQLPADAAARLPKGLRAPVMAALAPRPEQRPATARAFGESLPRTRKPNLAARLREFFGERPPALQFPSEPTEPQDAGGKA